MVESSVINDSVSEDLFADIIESLLIEAQKDEEDRRGQNRQPFFSPATIVVEEDNSRLFAFTRDLSKDGIGLLHSMPLEIDANITIVIHRLNSGAAHVKAHVEWCRPCGDGWYLSGGRLLGASLVT